MIARGARSGYEIRRAAELSVRFFWALGPPPVYAQLTALEADGLIAGRHHARGEPRRPPHPPGRAFGAPGPPQVYAQLKAREADGLIAGRDETRGERPRRHF